MANAFANTSFFLLNIIFGVFIALVLLRFLMQYFRIGFNNPIGQFIIQASNPLLMPLRRIIPPIGSLDTASLVLAFLLHVLFVFLAALLINYKINFIQILIWSSVGLLTVSMAIYVPLIFISVVSSWLPDLRHQSIVQIINSLVDPITAPFRKILPNLGGIDISPIIPLLIIQLIKIFLSSLPVLNPGFILGF